MVSFHISLLIGRSLMPEKLSVKRKVKKELSLLKKRVLKKKRTILQQYESGNEEKIGEVLYGMYCYMDAKHRVYGEDIKTELRLGEEYEHGEEWRE